MKILILDEEFPWPLNSGKRIRSYNLTKYIADRHDVRYLAYGLPSQDSYGAIQEIGAKPVPVRRRIPVNHGPMFYLRLLMNLLSPYPYIVDRHRSRKFAAAFREQMESFQPDLILCEWTPYAVFTQSVHGTPVVISAHNIEADIWRRYAENEEKLLRRLYIALQWKKVRHFESTVFDSASGITTVSSLDAAQARQLADRTRIEVVDNGVDLDFFKSNARKPHSGRIVFTGSMDWRPNQDAMKYFVREIFPLLKSSEEPVDFYIVGRNPSPDIVALGADKDITVTGEVDDVRPYMEEASVYAVPLRIGGGSRLKILEALAMEQAVVTTAIGAEGLEVEPNRHVLIGDSPEDFAVQIRRLFKDPELGKNLGRSGRRLVERRYGWEALGGRLDHFLKDMVAKK